MRLVTYCITFPEEVNVLPNMVMQAKKLGDVWLFDGGNNSTLCQNRYVEDDDAVRRFALAHNCRYTYLEWPGHPGEQRNAALEIMGDEYDWIIMNDSDELWTDQAVEGIPAFLESTNTTNALVKWLQLTVDEDHYWKKHFTHIVHARIHRPGAVRWTEGHWHEHQEFFGARTSTDFVLLHTKHLFVNRMKRMFGHGLEGWGDMDVTPLPPDRFGLTWPGLRYPDEDRVRS